MAGAAVATTAPEVAATRRSGPSTGAIVGGLLALVVIAAAVVGVTWIVRHSEAAAPATTPLAGPNSSASATGGSASAKTAIVTPQTPVVVQPVPGAVYWTSSQGGTRCVYYPVNKDGEPSVNCWHKARGYVYHLYSGKRVKVEYMSAVTAARATELAAQFNAAPGTVWKFNQSQIFSDPRTKSRAFQCTLYEIEGMWCVESAGIHGFQLNQATPRTW
jgi:hypothetical protein